MAAAWKKEKEVLEEKLQEAELEDVGREMLKERLREAELVAEAVMKDKEIMEETLATMALAHLQEKEQLEEKIEMLQAEMEKLLKSRWYFGRKPRPKSRGPFGHAT